VLGCVVNGPGEARETDIGITGGGNGKHMVYLSGVTDHHVEDADMLDHIVVAGRSQGGAEIEAVHSGFRAFVLARVPRMAGSVCDARIRP
jgi:(E)-4-hydroxy-3-methylbut-2-enyl-diphosphate synthase